MKPDRRVVVALAAVAVAVVAVAAVALPSFGDEPPPPAPDPPAAEAQPSSTEFEACRLIGVYSDVVVVVDGFRAQRMCDLFAEDEGFPGGPMAAVASGGEALRWEPPRRWVERCAVAARIGPERRAAARAGADRRVFLTVWDPGDDGARLCRVLRTSLFG